MAFRTTTRRSVRSAAAHLIYSAITKITCCIMYPRPNLGRESGAKTNGRGLDARCRVVLLRSRFLDSQEKDSTRPLCTARIELAEKPRPPALSAKVDVSAGSCSRSSYEKKGSLENYVPRENNRNKCSRRDRPAGYVAAGRATMSRRATLCTVERTVVVK